MTEPLPTAAADLGQQMHSLIRELFPICRSITGDGVRETLRIVGQTLPLQITETPSGTKVHDWVVPDEWNLRRATLRGPDGQIIADTAVNNLHIVNYSVPMKCSLSLAELRPHLHSIEDKPTLIPYRTSYYTPAWGFCLPHEVLANLPDGKYEVDIDADLAPGSLTYGEFSLPGESAETFVLSSHVCHPSLANDNLAGIAVAAFAARLIAQQQRRWYTYRFIFAPGTIGAITWLANNANKLRDVRHGLILSCLGDVGGLNYKQSRRRDADIDRAVELVLREAGRATAVMPFIPYGYDERQYCSPGINLPFGVLMRTPNGQYPEYHTSADNPDFVRPEALFNSLKTLMAIFDVVEKNRRYVNLAPNCEPQLGRRGLYSSTGGLAKPPGYELALLWVLNYSDGEHDLIDISRRSGIAFTAISTAAEMLQAAKLLEEIALSRDS